VDKIYVFKDGLIVEEGTHAELIEAKGLFYNMVEAQQIHREREQDMLSAIKGKYKISNFNAVNL
jgi:ABC-type dipeptide/oligopeptide/nickel transport system ATPase component